MNWTGNNNARQGVGSSKLAKQVVKTFSQRDIIRTVKFKIYKASQDVYTYDSKFVCHLDDSQYATMLSVLKYPTLVYKKRVDILIEGHPQSFEK